MPGIWVSNKINKNITVYELLGLIKEGKAPKRVAWGADVYTLKEDEQDYYSAYLDEYLIYSINGNGEKWLDEEVEIIEEEKEIEKLEIKNVCSVWTKKDELFQDKINEIIELINDMRG